MLMVMITLKRVSSEMNILSLKLFQRDPEQQQKRDINIKFLLTQIMKSLNIENILIMFLLLIIQKYLDFIPMLI